MIMHRAIRWTLRGLFFGLLILLCRSAHGDDLRQQFRQPPLKCAPRPLWFWNNTTVDVDEAVRQMRLARDKCGYGGFGILPFGKGLRPVYLSEDYFRTYGAVLAEAKKLGMTMCIYDEYGFPSGSAARSTATACAALPTATPAGPSSGWTSTRRT